MSDYVLLSPSVTRSPLVKELEPYLKIHPIGAIEVESLRNFRDKLEGKLDIHDRFKAFMSQGQIGLQAISYIDDDTRKLYNLSSAVVHFILATKSLVPQTEVPSATEQTRRNLRQIENFLAKVENGELPSVSSELVQKAVAAPRETLNDVLQVLNDTAEQIGTQGWRKTFENALAKDNEWLQQNWNNLVNHLRGNVPYAPEVLQFQETCLRELLASQNFPPDVKQWLENTLQGTSMLRQDLIAENLRTSQTGQTLVELQRQIELQTGLQQFQTGLPMVSPSDPSVIQLPFQLKNPDLSGTNQALHGYISLQKAELDRMAMTGMLDARQLNPQITFIDSPPSQLASPQFQTSLMTAAANFLSALESDQGTEKSLQETANMAMTAVPPGRVAAALVEIMQQMESMDKISSASVRLGMPASGLGMSS